MGSPCARRATPFTRVFPRWESVEVPGSVGPPRVWQGLGRRGRVPKPALTFAETLAWVKRARWTAPAFIHFAVCTQLPAHPMAAPRASMESSVPSGLTLQKVELRLRQGLNRTQSPPTHNLLLG